MKLLSYCYSLALFVIATTVVAFAHNTDNHVQGCCIVNIPKHTIQGVEIASQPQLQASIISPGKNFKIHFDTSQGSRNAVPNADTNKNGISDYVDSVAFYMDAAFSFEVTQLGFKEPLRDNFEGNTYDVFLVQLGKTPGFIIDGVDYGTYGVYGLTIPDQSSTNSCGKGVATTFILLDNDYSEGDSILSGSSMRRTYIDTGITALKITCFHEFHHMIQNAYSATEDGLFYEMTSTWMEHAGFPDILNYAQYVKRLFNNTELYCLRCSDRRPGSYGYSIMMQFFAERYGNDVIRRMWENIGNCTLFPMTALDQALRERNASLTSGWCEAMSWFYNTGYRTDSTKTARFTNAAKLPILIPDNVEISNQTFTEPSFSYTTSVYPFQFRMVRCLLPRSKNFTNDTVDFVLTNNNVESFNSESGASLEYRLTISKEALSGFKQIGSLNYYYMINQPDASICDAVFLNNGFGIKTIDAAYPNPFLLSEHRELIIPVSEEIPSDQKVDVYIFAPDGIGVYAATQKIESRNLEKIIAVELPTTRISSGVYLFSVTWKDSQTIGKFTVKK